MAGVNSASLDLIRESTEPEEAVEIAVGAKGTVNAIGDNLEAAPDRLAYNGTRQGQGRESLVFCLEPQGEQRSRHGLAFELGGDVAHDSEQIAGVGAVGQRPGASLCVEDGDAVHDGVEWIATDGDTYVALGSRRPRRSKWASNRVRTAGRSRAARVARASS